MVPLTIEGKIIIKAKNFTFYCFCRGPLPCTLNLGVANPAFLDGGDATGGSNSDNDDDFLGLDLPQYHLLT